MIKRLLLTSLITISLANAQELNTQMQAYMNSLKVEAKKQNPNFTDFSYERGKEIFTSKHIGKKKKLISCESCHTKNLSDYGKNIHTSKVIDPLSPSANPKRFTKVKDVKKWLRRNFRDVYVRVGTAQEKGDVITYIVNQK